MVAPVWTNTYYTHTHTHAIISDALQHSFFGPFLLLITFATSISRIFTPIPIRINEIKTKNDGHVQKKVKTLLFLLLLFCFSFFVCLIGSVLLFVSHFILNAIQLLRSFGVSVFPVYSICVIFIRLFL